jgi:hypothetical protein
MYKAVKPILYQADGRSWKPGDVVPLQTIPPAVAEAWLDEAIVIEVNDEPKEEPKKRGRPPKEGKDDSTDSA